MYLADRVDVVLELPGLLVLCQVALGLEAAVGGEEDVLDVAHVDGVVPAGQPRDGAVVLHAAPAVALHGAGRDLRVLPNVDGHLTLAAGTEGE